MRTSTFPFGAALAALAAAWLAFRFWPVADAPPEALLEAAVAFNEGGRASFVGVEPYMTAADYRSAKALSAKLALYLDAAADRGWLTPRTVVIFPEHVATWLVAANGPAAVYDAPRAEIAMAALIAANPIDFALRYAASSEKDRAAAALFRMRGRQMAEDYTEIFGGLARDYGVTVVAGSVVLEEPRVESGRVIAGKGVLYNASAVFTPDGRAAPGIVRKVYPIPSERGFSASGASSALPVFETPAGALGVLICADSWHPDLYDQLAAGGAELIAVPAFLEGHGAWSRPWAGYVTPAPAGVAPADVGGLTEGEAWLRYAMAGRAAGRGVYGMTVFLRGDFWGFGADGRTIAIGQGRADVATEAEGGAIAALWLDD